MVGDNGFMSQTPKRRRHLLDMENPQVAVRRRDPMPIGEVQKWVMSVLAVSTVLHMAGALILFAATFDESKQGSQIGVLIISGAFGILAVMTGRIIHKVSPFTPWVVLGLIPMAIGFWWIFGR